MKCSECELKDFGPEESFLNHLDDFQMVPRVRYVLAIRRLLPRGLLLHRRRRPGDQGQDARGDRALLLPPADPGQGHGQQAQPRRGRHPAPQAQVELRRARLGRRRDRRQLDLLVVSRQLVVVEREPARRWPQRGHPLPDYFADGVRG